MNAKHWTLILGGLGVIVAVWAALRKPAGSAPTVVVENSPSLTQPTMYPASGVTPLNAPPVQDMTPAAVAQTVAQTVAQATQQAVQPGTGGSGVPQLTAQTQAQAGSSPIVAAQPQGASFYGPVMRFINSMVPQATPASVPIAAQVSTAKAPGSCGCGGSCGGACGTCATQCSINNSRFPDGRGGCLSFNRQTQIAQAIKSNPLGMMAHAANLESANPDMYAVFQQTMFDHAYNDRSQAPPASPFLTPI